MTSKTIEALKHLAVITMTSDYLNNDMKIERYKEIMHYLDMTRDFFLIDEKKRKKIAEEIGAAAMDAYKEYTDSKKSEIA